MMTSDSGLSHDDDQGGENRSDDDDGDGDDDGDDDDGDGDGDIRPVSDRFSTKVLCKHCGDPNDDQKIKIVVLGAVVK